MYKRQSYIVRVNPPFLLQVKTLLNLSLIHIYDAVARILRVKFRLGLFDEPYTKELTEQERYLQKEDLALAARLAEDSMVLLKNEKNWLPLSATVKRVALIGPRCVEETALHYYAVPRMLVVPMCLGLTQSTPYF